MGKTIEQSEVPTHKKKSKTSTKSNSSKRADHKHDYERVVLVSFFGYEWGGRCKICGRIDSRPYSFSATGRNDFLRPEAIGKPGITSKDYLSTEEIKSKYPDVRIFEYDDSVPYGWMKYKEMT